MALIGVLFATFATHRLSLWRERRVRLAAASRDFRSAFAVAILNLEHNSGHPTRSVVYNIHTSHLAAIDAFRPHVSFWRRSGFENAATEYRQQAEAYNQQGPLAALASEQGPQAQAQRAALVSSIQGLLGHADSI